MVGGQVQSYQIWPKIWRSNVPISLKSRNASEKYSSDILFIRNKQLQSFGTFCDVVVNRLASKKYFFRPKARFSARFDTTLRDHIYRGSNSMKNIFLVEITFQTIFQDRNRLLSPPISQPQVKIPDLAEFCPFSQLPAGQLRLLTSVFQRLTDIIRNTLELYC